MGKQPAFPGAFTDLNPRTVETPDKSSNSIARSLAFLDEFR
jgi:hypothetical protein